MHEKYHKDELKHLTLFSAVPLCHSPLFGPVKSCKGEMDENSQSTILKYLFYMFGFFYVAGGEGRGKEKEEKYYKAETGLQIEK